MEIKEEDRKKWKLVLKNNYKNHVEELRSMGGDYQSEVFFWDIVLKERFGSREEAKDFIEKYV